MNTAKTPAFERLEQRLQPRKNLSPEQQKHQQRLATLVGAIAIALPVFTMLVGAFKWTCFYQSLSHYYYSPITGTFFIGCLGFIGGYLITWQGQSKLETQLATLAGPMAWLVAFFPTEKAGCDEGIWKERGFAQVFYANTGDASQVTVDPVARYHILFDGAFTIHIIAALILFAVLAFFAFVVFPREVPHRDRPDGVNLSPEKAARNKIYRLCGWIIVVSIGAIGLRVALGFALDLSWWERINGTFWCEAFALSAFGFSWMVKGRFWGYALVDQTMDTPAPM